MMGNMQKDEGLEMLGVGILVHQVLEVRVEFIIKEQPTLYYPG
jgi:hypothetical protein